MDNKDKRPGIALPVALLALSAIAVLAILLGHDAVVISHGIKAYRAARTAAWAAMAACAGWTALAVARRARWKPEREISEPMQKRSFDEADRNAMYRELADFGAKKWSGMDGISALIRQLDSMDEYQAELGRLLEQTIYLKQKPAEIVQQVEDCMYVNIKKLLNYMRIVQTKSPSVMREKISFCVEKNGDLLKKTDDFVVAVVGYVNGDMAPGEEEKTKDYVDSYMFVVLQAIELPETYLK